MRKIRKPKYLQQLVCFTLLAVIAVCVPVLAVKRRNDNAAAGVEQRTVLSVWQIDSFEGGKGSRADFLQSAGDGYSERAACYINVISLSAEAARQNLSAGTVPDIISYGAGVYGLESYIDGYTQWCHGSYCFLTVDGGADFADISPENTVINAGKENLSGGAALFCGVNGADVENSTTAYVKLLGGKYKYLLGTQRDVFRLITRGVSFKVKPVTQFNDLYQNISVTAQGRRTGLSQGFIDYLTEKLPEVNKIGLLGATDGLYDNEMRELEGLDYECKLTSPVSFQTRQSIENAIFSNNINMLKNLLK